MGDHQCYWQGCEASFDSWVTWSHHIQHAHGYGLNRTYAEGQMVSILTFDGRFFSLGHIRRLSVEDNKWLIALARGGFCSVTEDKLRTPTAQDIDTWLKAA